MTEQYLGKATRGNPPANYERFLPQRVARAWNANSAAANTSFEANSPRFVKIRVGERL